MNRADVLAEGVLSTKMLLSRYLVGFDETTALHQTPNLPNHVIWNLGHKSLIIALTSLNVSDITTSN